MSAPFARLLAMLALHHRCAAEGRSTPPGFPEVDDLERDVTAVIGVYARVIVAGRADAAVASPGYIRFGEAPALHAPLHLAQDLLDATDDLGPFVHVGRRTRIVDDSALCLSGSSVFRHVGVDVADLDFCEYIDAALDSPPCRDLSAELDQVHARTSAELLWLRSKVRGVNPSNERRASRDSSPADVVAFRACAETASSGKADFFARCDGEGAIEATNVFLVVSPADRDGGSARMSFAHQEVVVGDWVPRTLTDGLEIGRYLLWLRTQTATLLARGNALKAAKRALSLARFAYLGHLGNALLDALAGSDVVRAAVVRERCRLWESLTPDACGSSSVSVSARRATIATLQALVPTAPSGLADPLLVDWARDWADSVGDDAALHDAATDVLREVDGHLSAVGVS